MASPGDVLVDPCSNRKLVFRRTTRQTAGRLLEFSLHYPTREARPEPHTHAVQEHQVEVLSGVLRAEVSGRLQVLRPGDVLLICPGDTHAIWNAATRPAHAVWHTFPALDTEAELEGQISIAS